MNRPRLHASRRAMTLIEVLLAVLMLAMMMGVVMSAVSSIVGMESRGHMRLAAYEVANRIMLQFLDDEKGLPPKTEAVEYGIYRLMWRIDKTTATMNINRKQESSSPNLQKLDRFQLICVTVYEAEQDGNFETKGEPLAYLTRVIDPYTPRNPDSIETFSNDPTKIQEMIQSIIGSGGSGSDAARLQGRQLK
jgi:hypothetical protein